MCGRWKAEISKGDRFGLLVTLLQQAIPSWAEVCSDLQRKKFCTGPFLEGFDCEVLQTVPELLSGALSSK